VTKLSIDLTAARLLESKSRADAIKQLQSIVAETTRRGYVGLAFRARLALAEMEGRAGDRAGARAHLASLEKDAAARASGSSPARSSGARYDFKGMTTCSERRLGVVRILEDGETSPRLFLGLRRELDAFRDEL